MNKYLMKFREQIEKRNPRERMVFLIILLAVIFFIWEIFFESGMTTKAIAVTQQASQEKTQLKGIQAQIDHIIYEATKKPDPMLLQQVADMNKQLANINTKLTQDYPKLVDTKNLSAALENIVLAANNLNLNGLDITPTDVVTNTKISTSPDITFQNVEIHFVGGYFTTVAYLQRLTQLQTFVGLDNINYQVTTYPSADVTIMLHLLRIKDGVING